MLSNVISSKILQRISTMGLILSKNVSYTPIYSHWQSLYISHQFVYYIGFVGLYIQTLKS